MDVFVNHYSLPPVDRLEWYRYMGVIQSSEELEALADECRREAENCFSPRVCYCEIPVCVEGDIVDLTFWKGNSRSLSNRLRGCDHAILFAATVGLEIDRLIARYNRISSAKAVCLQALGTERVEALCDAFCAEMNAKSPRFSPGYGDLPLDIQKHIFELLNCPKNIGLTLNGSLLMSPTKSVTAIVGVE